MKNATGLIIGYLVIGLLFAIYQTNWGQYSYRPFSYNLGQGLVWPAVMFPVLGKIIAGIVIIALVIGGLIAAGRSK